jgi:hypothetical protein
MMMANYWAHGITQAGVADDRTNVTISFAAAPEPLTLSMDWRLASELIDKLALVNIEIRHALSAPDTRAIRFRTGCHRAGVGLAAIAVMPALWGLWRGVQGVLDAEGWKIIGLFMLAAPFVYGAAWLTGWIVAGFMGSRDQGPT